MEAMVSNPAEYIRKWQKSVIADLGVGTTLIEQLQLQASGVRVTSTACFVLHFATQIVGFLILGGWSDQMFDSINHFGKIYVLD